MNKAQRLVLLAEDDDDDFFFVERAFQKCASQVELARARNGEEAVKALEARGKEAGGIDLLLLDLKMPRLNGLQVLEWLQGAPQHRTMPVLMLSSSAEPTDVRRAYDLGAISYFVKPTRSSDLDEMVKVIARYWLELNLRPK